ncbi:succinate--CoA ligase subunit alpha [Candidatus Nitrosocosmicus sp. SS]|uniref:succinate--CoA ligase subunit alpha n=1 Tax=Candidatus Nitrosocosmicus agrestis TaxID=2563600 RepID=UPI00122E1D13|nr:succinate--CoA ligase subunit alpha [Candidatus Nitrosocosmicus sp. SS]KAF0869023.1 succinate--CoA ligase subunit alpha [Candidatus Nitrosocosmicus sp. SS]
MYNIFSILVGNNSDVDYEKKPVIIQGITGSFGSKHANLMKSYGTNIAAGVTPGKGGSKFEDVPIYNTMKEAVEATGSVISGVFVPAPFFYKAAKEALDSGIKLLVAIPEHVPIIDSIKIFQYAEEKGARMIGPNTPGVIVPGIMKVGIMPAQPFTKGQTIVFSRSGTLMYEVSHHLSNSGLGQRLALGIGGDPINGTNLIDSFNLIQNRDDVDSVVVVGEIGGDAEEMLADHIIKTGFTKPVVAYIAGRAAPKEKRMGHAGAIVYGTYGSADSKITNYARADVPVAKSPREVPLLLKTKLRK